jgi:DNA-binding XRE family transcriptional regulator
MRMTNLRAIREARDISREKLAKKADISMKTIEAHEYGRAQDVAMSIAKPLADALEVPIEDLFLPENTGLRIKPESAKESA